MEIRAFFSADTKQLDSASKKLERLGVHGEKAGEGISHGMDKAGRGVSTTNAALKGLGGVLGTLGLASLATDAMNTYRSFESMNASLKTMTGSAAAADVAFAKIEEFAKTTPYNLEQSVQGFVKLKALGLDPSMEALRSYGNTASAMGKDLMQMVEAVADASTGEFERLKEFGIKASQEKDKVSFTFQGVTTTVAKNSKEIQKYLLAIGNNQFGTAMADQMATVNGAVSNAQDTFAKLQRTLIEQTGAADLFKSSLGGISSVMESAIGWINSATKAVQHFMLKLEYSGDWQYEALRAVGDAIAWIGDAIDPVLPYLGEFAAWAAGSGAVLGIAALAVSGLSAAFAALASPITLAVAAIAGIGMAASYIYDNWDGVVDWWNNLWSDVESAASGFFNWWSSTTLIEKVADIATFQIETARSVATGFFDWWDQSTLKQHSPPFVTDTIDSARQSIEDFFDWWDNTTLTEKVADVTAETLIWAWEQAQKFEKWWNNLSLKSLVPEIKMPTMAGIKESAGGMWDWAKGVGGDIADGIGLGIDRADAHISAAKKAAKGIETAVRTELDTHSPSRVMAAVGMDVSTGFAVGIESGSKKVKTAAEKAAKAAESAFQRIVEGLEKQYLKLTAGDEAARRYELSMQGIVGANQDAVIAAEAHIKKLQEQEKKQKDAAQAAQRAAEEQKRIAKTLTDSLLTPYEVHEKAIKQYDELLRAGAITQKTYARAVKKQARVLADATGATEKAKAKQDAYNKIMAEGRQLTKSLRDPQEVLNDAIGEYKKLLKAGAITQETYNRALADQKKKLDDATGATAAAKAKQEAHNKLLSEAEALYKATRNDAEKYATEVTALGKLLKAGVITQDTYNRALKNAQESYTDAGKAAKAYQAESKALADKIKILEAGLYGNEEAARRAELELKNYNKAQIAGIMTDENRVKSLEKTKKGLEDLEAAAEKTSESINKSLTDAFLSGDFKSIGSQLVNTFKNDIAAPILNRVMKPLADGITNSFGNIGNSISRSLGQGNLFGTTGSGQGLFSVIQGGGISGALGAGGLGFGFGQMIGQTGIGSGVGAGIGNMIMPGIGGVVGGLLGGLVESLFGGKQSIRANFGQFAEHGSEDRWYHTKRSPGKHMNRESAFGAFGLVNGSRSVGRDDPKQVAAMHAMLDQMKALDDAIASFLPDSTVERIKTNLTGFEGNALNAVQLTKQRMIQIFKGMDAPLRRAFQGGKNTMAGTAEEIAARFQYIAQINAAQFVPALEKLGWNLGNTETKALAAAVGLTDAAGGLDKLKSGLESYYQVVFTAAERQELEKATAQAALDAFNAANNAHITSLESFRRYVEGLDKQTDAGQKATAAALELVGSIKVLYGTADEATRSTEGLSSSIDDVSDASKRADDLERQRAMTIKEAYDSAIKSELERAYEIEYGTEALRKRKLLESGWTQQMIDNLYALKARNEQAALAADNLSDTTANLGNAANDAARDVAGLQNSISGLISRLYSGNGSGSTGNGELGNAQAQLEGLRNQYSAEQQRIQNLNSTAQEAYNAELNRIRELNAANQDAYREQLAQYNSLKSAAESLRDFVEGWTRSNPLLTPFEQLQEIQAQYNSKLAAARSGDIEAAQELQSLAGELRSAYLDVYASSATSEAAISKITSDLSGLASVFDAHAGNQPAEPANIAEPAKPAEITSTLLTSLERQINSQQQLVNSLQSSHESASAESDRKALALELASKIGELGLALDTSVFDLLRENGVAINALAKDFGINIGNLDSSMLSGLDALADALQVDTVSLASELGADISALGGLIANKLSTLPGVPSAIRNGLAPFLRAIESANDDTSLRAALGAVEFAVNGVAPNIRSQLSSKLDAIVSSNSPAATVSAVNALQAYINSLPMGIKSQLNYQLSSILTNTGSTKLATDAVKNQASLINSSVSGLPPNIKAQLNAQLNAVIGHTDSVKWNTNQTRLLSQSGRDWTKNVYNAAISGRDWTKNVDTSVKGQTQTYQQYMSDQRSNWHLLHDIESNTDGLGYSVESSSYSERVILDALKSILNTANQHHWINRKNLNSQNRNWSKAGKRNISSYRIGTDALPSDGLIMAHKNETIFNPSQSLSLREKTLASLDALPVIEHRLAAADDKPRAVQQQIHVNPSVINARPVFQGRQQQNNQEQYIRRLESKFDEQKEEIRELREVVRHYGNVRAKQGDVRIAQGEESIKQRQQARKDARLQQQLKEANG